MRWNVLTLFSAPESIDAISHALMEIGCGGVVIQGENPARIQGSIPQDERAEERIASLRAHLARLPEFGLPALCGEITLHEADDEDWAEAWKKHFKPAKIGNRIVIKPTWEPYVPQPDEIVLELDPGMAFGTGGHPTTRLCILCLEDRLVSGACVADIGTGSGILAIAAAKLGAKSVVATDIDALARRVSQENVSQNHLEDQIAILDMETFDAQAKECDLIVANIIAQIIVDMAPTVSARLKPNGLFLASGIVEEYHDAVRDACAAAGMTHLETKREDIWVGMVFQKNADPSSQTPAALPRSSYPWAV